MTDLIRIRGLVRSYRIGKERLVPVLKGLDLDIQAGEFVALMGPSGSGKSTLMNVIGMLDGFDGGSYHFQDRDVSTLRDDALAQMRARALGFVFQQFNLVPQLTVWENVAMPLFYLGGSARERRQRAATALERVGLAHRLDHRPLQLSGGEMQRAAIARSLITDPPLLVADEPTGNLDSRTGCDILALFQRLHAEGLTLLMVTHDPGVAKRADRVIHLRDGAIVDALAAQPAADAIGGTLGDAPAPTPTTASARRPPSRLHSPHPLRLHALIGMALSSLRHHKLRAMLTALGIIFGVGAVISMLAISAGARQEALNTLAGMGLNSIRLSSVEPPAQQQDDDRRSWWKTYGVSDADRARLTTLLPDIEALVSTRREDHPVWTPEAESVGHLVLTSAAYAAVAHMPVTRGRFLHALDDARAQPVCVLGQSLARDLFGPHDPLGELVYLREDGVPARVVGLLAPLDAPLPGTGLEAATVNRAVFLSEDAAQFRLGFPQGTELNHIADLILRFPPDTDIISRADLIRRSMETHHDKDDWALTVPAELLRQKERTSRIFAIVMGSIAGISLLVGGIGIMNIMLATVLERTREIGIRRAVGARRSDIVKQFLVETVVLSTCGGILGVGMGVGGATLVSQAAGWPTTITGTSIVLALGISGLVGLIFGLYPAWRAANLKPVEALRSA